MLRESSCTFYSAFNHHLKMLHTSWQKLICCMLLATTGYYVFALLRCLDRQCPGTNPDESTHMVYMTASTARGRLGNHLFQYAALLAISKRQNRIPLLPSNYDVYHHFKANKIEQVNKTDDYTKSGFGFSPQKAYVYDNATELFTLIPVTVKLHGFYISWRYFIDIEHEIRDEFTFQDAVLGAAHDFLNKRTPVRLNTTRYRIIGTHVRRGDLLDFRNIHGGYRVPGADYFSRAMKYFQKKYQYIHFVVCSDDIPWSKKQFAEGHITYSENNPSAVDLAILSLCDDVIMSVGTFGWWGAWLAQGEVIYYTNWFTPGSYMARQQNGEDYFPRSWIGMP
jgi:galactoside 2-L-fucosyltransferase 1/2